MIGLFDSGLGGLTVVRRVHDRLPEADLLFFADQAHVPYGDRTPDDLHRLLSANLAWLDAQGAATIVIGCNTSCAIAETYGWPSTRAHVLDLIDSAATSVQRAGYRRVGVVATAATVRAGSYGRTLRSAVAGAEVWEVAAPALVPLVEAGEIGTSCAEEAVAAVCAELPGDLDAVIYGCTHYPLLEEHFRNALGANVALVDPATMQAERAAHLSEGVPAESGRVRYVTSGDLERFRENVGRIMNETDPDVSTAVPAAPDGAAGMIPSHAWP
ncbi:MAG TPA: glutamate racemase [Candidatus Baltobacteraceae bacterium]|nr:glutamate racemase [Candidatus Baltobacteraceae bacterium]